MDRFVGKNVVITGGTSGIGLATARLLAAEGAQLVLTGRTPSARDAAQSEFGSQAHVTLSDASSIADIMTLRDTARELFGEVDFLFINAGITRWVPFEEMTASEYDLIFQVNTRGPYFLAQQFAGLMREGGSIVFTTSVVDVIGFPLVSAYAASKAAVRSMTRSLARELLPRNVRVNAVSPGVIDTDVLEKGVSKAVSDSAKVEVAANNPMRRLGRPEEIARAAIFLAFDATYTTGAEIPVDGGSTQI